jgi:hypothetical protein
MAIISVALIFTCRNVNGQPGYSPWSRMPSYGPVMHPYPPPQSVRPSYGPVMRPYPPPQSVRPVYNPYARTGGFRPYINFGIHFDPLISWFSTDSYNSHNDGVVPGFNLGFSYNSYFTPNYAFSSGISIINAGGRLISGETTTLELKNYSYNLLTVLPGEAVTYKITYLSIPLGLKLQTNQLGYGRFFTDFGFDPKIVIGARADIPSLSINGGNALPEMNPFNLSFHIMAGMEYPLGGTSSMVVGVGYENSFFDITRDNGGHPSDMVSQRLMSFRIGVIF